MHSLKVALLLIGTLAVMRAVSWLIGWGIYQLRKRVERLGLVAANVLALERFK